ncbi:unnamed protein product [Boreogadus saida]
MSYTSCGRGLWVIPARPSAFASSTVLPSVAKVVRRVLQEEEIRGELWSERSTPPDEPSPLSAPGIRPETPGLHGPQRAPGRVKSRDRE